MKYTFGSAFSTGSPKPPKKKLTPNQIKKIVYDILGKKIGGYVPPKTSTPKKKKPTDKQMKDMVKLWTGRTLR